MLNIYTVWAEQISYEIFKDVLFNCLENFEKNSDESAGTFSGQLIFDHNVNWLSMAIDVSH
jgi:hypothetical protein